MELSGLPWLIGGRFLQGLGGGGLVPLSLALAADLYSGERRTFALGTVAALQEAGSVFGPLYGATLAALAGSFGTWRFVFWVNLPLAALCAVGLVAAGRGRPMGVPESGSTRVDWGTSLLGLGLGLLVIALYPDDPSIRATSGLLIPVGIVAIAVLSVYGWRQLRFTLTAMLTLALGIGAITASSR